MTRVRHAGLEKGGLEEPRIEVAHHLRGAHGGEVGGALMMPPGAERIAEREQNQRPRQERADQREHHERSLALLPVPSDRPTPLPSHVPGLSRALCYPSTGAWNKSATGRRFTGPETNRAGHRPGPVVDTSIVSRLLRAGDGRGDLALIGTACGRGRRPSRAPRRPCSHRADRRNAAPVLAEPMAAATALSSGRRPCARPRESSEPPKRSPWWILRQS